MDDPLVSDAAPVQKSTAKPSFKLTFVFWVSIFLIVAYVVMAILDSAGFIHDDDEPVPTDLFYSFIYVLSFLVLFLAIELRHVYKRLAKLELHVAAKQG